MLWSIYGGEEFLDCGGMDGVTYIMCRISACTAIYAKSTRFLEVWIAAGAVPSDSAFRFRFFARALSVRAAFAATYTSRSDRVMT